MTKALICLSVVSFSVYVMAQPTKSAYFLQENFINKINEEATTWKAGVNFDPNTPEENILRLLGSKGVQDPNAINPEIYKSHDEVNTINKIPDRFDARKKWAFCDTIGEIRNQGNCGSCWAFATSSAFADRLCIATNGEFNSQLSADELTFCCRVCGEGCQGGYPIDAWDYFGRHGLVTGGSYNTTNGCQPYRIAPCIRDKTTGKSSCAGKPTKRNYKCRNYCYGDENIDFDNDHKHTKESYFLSYKSIQSDVLKYGPIEASFYVYDDFVSYKSGVYIKSPNATYLGGHAVKLIGWGTEKDVPYWLLVNSWSENWGNEGTFKIRRGTNECGIDYSTTSGIPAIN